MPIMLGKIFHVIRYGRMIHQKKKGWWANDIFGPGIVIPYHEENLIFMKYTSKRGPGSAKLYNSVNLVFVNQKVNDLVGALNGRWAKLNMPIEPKE